MYQKQKHKRNVKFRGEREIIHTCDKGQKKTVVDKEYEVPQSSLSKIFKNHHQF